MQDFSAPLPFNISLRYYHKISRFNVRQESCDSAHLVTDDIIARKKVNRSPNIVNRVFFEWLYWIDSDRSFFLKPLFPTLHGMGRNLLGVMAGVFPEMKKHGHAPARIPLLSPVSKDTPKGR